MGKTPWKGIFELGDGFAWYVGFAEDADRHTHHAVQITIALEEPFRLRADRQHPWLPCEAVLIPPNRPHELAALGKPLAFLYLDPECGGTPRWLKTHDRRTFHHLSVDIFRQSARRLRDCLSKPAKPNEAGMIFKGILGDLGFGRDSTKPPDPRLGAVLKRLGESSGASVPLKVLAAEVGLSPSRLGHLFSDGVGLPLRKYQLWMRLRKAIRLMKETASLTEAAHAAEFADSAHFSRTFRRMFGIAPSQLTDL